MTTVELLWEFKKMTEQNTDDLLLPVARQEDDKGKPKPRAATVHLMGLPETSKAEKKAPYIVHMAAEGNEKYTDRHDGYGGREQTRHLADTVELRSVICVYGPDRQEGGLLLLELMDRLRRMMRQNPVIGLFQLDLDTGIDWTVYDSDEWDLGPYHVGGIVTTWIKKEGPRPEVATILRGDRREGKLNIPGVYGEDKRFLKGETDHGE